MSADEVSAPEWSTAKKKQTPQLLFRLQQSLLRTLHVYLFILYTYFSLQFVRRPTCPPKFVLDNCRPITLSQYMPKKRYDYWFYISFICQRHQVQGPADRFIQKICHTYANHQFTTLVTQIKHLMKEFLSAFSLVFN